MRVIFMGTPAFALPALKALLASEHTVVAAYSQPPRPAGRGQKLTPSPVQQLAEKHGVPVYTPTSLKSAEAQQQFAALRADIAVVTAYGLLLPQAILDAPKHGCINIHPSDLPRWRGAAPIQRTIMAGDKTTACCIMQMDAGLDTGDVLLREAYSIPHGTTAGALHDVMASIGASQVIDVLSTMPPAITQSDSGVTYAAKITKADQWIDWAQPATGIYQQILGLSPAPGTLCRYGDEVWKIFAAEVTAQPCDAAPGTLLDNRLLVATGQGCLRITRLQRPNKAAMDAADFLRGSPVDAGYRLIGEDA
jgi:methionyl-tRNA formyltransferase